MDFYKAVKEEYLRCSEICQILRRYADLSLKGHVSVRRNKDGTARFYHVFRDPETGRRRTERIEDPGRVNELNRKNACLRWQIAAEKNAGLLKTILAQYTVIDLPLSGLLFPNGWMCRNGLMRKTISVRSVGKISGPLQTISDQKV